MLGATSCVCVGGGRGIGGLRACMGQGEASYIKTKMCAMLWPAVCLLLPACLLPPAVVHLLVCVHPPVNLLGPVPTRVNDAGSGA